jgi:hypothetical protein
MGFKVSAVACRFGRNSCRMTIGSLVLFLLVAFSLQVANAHEEPNKTLREREEKHRERQMLSRANVRETTIYRHDVAKGEATGQKTRALSQKYDNDGCLLLISAFRNNVLSESAAYSYGPDGDMISDIDLDSCGHPSEATFFRYDSAGRMSEGFAYTTAGRQASHVVQRFDPSHRTITFEKFLAGDSLEYAIAYQYAKDFDVCDYSTAVKLNAQKDTILMVSKTFDGSGRVTGKNVHQFKPESTFRFAYEYSKDSLLTAVTKLNKDDKVETTTRYAFNKDRTYAAKRDYDASGTLISLLTFEYRYFNN